MIRPFTCLCVLLAAGSGLYLYQTKHRTLMLDQQIADVLKQADVARAQSVELRATYALLNQPQRLTDLAGRFLSLKPMAVTQYVQLAGLDQRLPPVQQFPRPGEAPVQPSAATPENTTDDADPADTDPEAPQATPMPIAAPRIADARPAVHEGAEAPRAYAANVPLAHETEQASPLHSSETETMRPATRVSESVTLPRNARRTALPDNQFAGGYHAQPMPMAAPRPVSSAVLATAALHPAGAAFRPRITNATAFEPAYRAPGRAQSGYNGAGFGGSMLGGSGSVALAPPVPVAN